MVSTESIIHINRYQSPRDYINSLLAREEIQALLISQGIDPQEAQARIDHLADDEIGEFFIEIDRLPAGGGSSAGVVVYFIIFILLAVIDLYYSNATAEK